MWILVEATVPLKGNDRWEHYDERYWWRSVDDDVWFLVLGTEGIPASEENKYQNEKNGEAGENDRPLHRKSSLPIMMAETAFVTNNITVHLRWNSLLKNLELLKIYVLSDGPSREYSQ